MATTGFGPRDVDEGWALLRAACSVDVPPAPPKPTDLLDARRAVATFVRTVLPRARAVTRRFHPDYEEFLFSTSRDALLIVAVFVDRCDALRSSPKRRRTRKRDAAVLASLASRGITDAVLDEARRNLELARGGRAIPEPPREAPRANREAQVALHAWVRDWSECARAVITRRDWLIRLGIGRRKPRRRRSVTADSIRAKLGE